MIRALLIPSSDYLGHPFPQRHNHIFERIHDGKNFEIHVIRFNIFGKTKLSSNCVIHEIPLELTTGKTSTYYLVNAMSYLYEILRIVKQESIDVVVAGNILPPLLFKLAIALSDLKVPFIFDLQDYYPTSATGYIFSVSSSLAVMVKGFFESMTRTLLGRSNAVTVPGIALYLYAKRVRRKINQANIYVVPNGISEHFFVQHDGHNLRNRLGYSDHDLVVGYVGSIEFWLDMKTLIKAISRIHQEGFRIKFLLVGGRLQTTYVNKVDKWIRYYSIKRITDHIGFLEHEKVPEYVAAMDVGTIPFDLANPTAYYAAPNKLWEYLSQGTIVVSTQIPEVVHYRGLISSIHVVENEEDYIRTLKNIAARKTNDEVNRDAIVQEVKSHLEKRTWNKSAELFKEVIKATIYR